MILSGSEIIKQIKKGFLIIDPFDNKRINPNSYNLRLSDKLIVYDSCILDIKKQNKIRELVIPETGLIIHPGEIYLGSTVEYTETHGLVPMLEGRSSIGRLGIQVHITAGFGDCGFCGRWTLEISCVKRVKIYPFIEICQIFYHTIEGEKIDYQGKYQDQSAVKESLMWSEFNQKNDADIIRFDPR